MVSIIIPVYNSGEYIQRCIESVLNQTYKRFELILIDDGSSDSSGKICDEYALLDNRIIVVHNTNHGVSYSRNLGIEKASADWILFVDSDDELECNYVNQFFLSNNIYDTLKIAKIKVCSCSKGGEETYAIMNHAEGSYDLNTAFELYKMMHKGFTVGKLYNRSLLQANNIKFNEKVSFKEDLLFFLEYSKYCKSLELLSDSQESFYKYKIHCDSLSTKYHTPETNQN